MALPNFDFDGSGDLGENIRQVVTLGYQAPCVEVGSPLLKDFPESDEGNDIRVETESLLQANTLGKEPTTTAQSLRKQCNTLYEPSSKRTIGSQLYDITYGSLELLRPWFPNIDPDHQQAKTWRAWHSRREILLGTWLGIAIAVLLLNFTFLIVAWVKFPISPDRILTLYTGSCSTVKTADTLLHVLINALSTLLLSASNGCLQLIVAPTRAEIDRAHSRQIWLDIGILSFRNLRYISRKRVSIWSLLVLSSIPLHFLYNAVIFTAIPWGSYNYALVTKAFLPNSTNGTIHSSTASSTSSFQEIPPGYPGRNTESSTYHNSFLNIVQMYYDVQENFTQYETLSSLECWQEYDHNPFQMTPRSVLVVSNKPTNNSLLGWSSYSETKYLSNSMLPDWLWTGNNSLLAAELTNVSVADYWNSHGNQVQYCLRRFDTSQLKSFDTCYLQGSPYLMLVVCICNFVKCISIIWTLVQTKRAKKESQSTSHSDTEGLKLSKKHLLFENSALCTLGDAIASFLEIPDHTTRILGIVSWFQFEQNDILWSDIRSVKWQPSKFKWYQAASTRRRLLTVVVTTMILLGGIIVFISGWVLERKDYNISNIQGMWSLGFGTTNEQELVSWNQPTSGLAGLFVNVLIANIWQVLLSLAYILNNALLSSMLVADEWAGFASERKTLRVSNPKGIQRSNYFISLPLRYGLPIMALFSIEHWLLSQAMFLIRVIEFINVDGGVITEESTTSGFSMAPALLAIILLSLLIIAQLLYSYFRTYPSSELAMPLASTCSAAISAACHRPVLDTDAYLLPVQWGVIDEDAILAGDDEPSEEKLKRCAFTTARDLRMPKAGELLVGRDGDYRHRRKGTSKNEKQKRAGSVFRRMRQGVGFGGLFGQ